MFSKVPEHPLEVLDHKMGHFSIALDNYDTSIGAIAEITKRNTGEYCIRPFIRKYPKQTLAQMKAWAQSGNFHLRRLASEGLRPKLPWAPNSVC